MSTDITGGGAGERKPHIAHSSAALFIMNIKDNNRDFKLGRQLEVTITREGEASFCFNGHRVICRVRITGQGHGMGAQKRDSLFTFLQQLNLVSFYPFSNAGKFQRIILLKKKSV